MRSSLLVLFCCICTVLAYPYELQEDSEFVPVEELQYGADDVLNYEQPLHRFRRQLKLQGGGGGSPGKGYDISIDGRAPVWTSNNGRHSLDATGGYSQHLGGPYGNSRPDFRGGAAYTFRF